jgi:integrase
MPGKTSLKGHAEGFLLLKRSLGYKYLCGEYHLASIVAYADKSLSELPHLSKEVVIDWAKTRNGESAATLARRISVVREFARYLISLGEDAYLLPAAFSPRITKYEPHVFTRDELLAFFSSLDGDFRPTSMDAVRHLAARAVFRVMYCCGLRPKEICGLSCSDVDLNDYTFIVIQGKGRRDRRLYIDDGLCSYLRDFDFKMECLFPRRKAFFPSADGGFRKPHEISIWFKTVWSRIVEELPPDCKNAPRAYDLRHYFCTRRIELWLERGEDIAVLQPYLMAFMGHANFRETDYYIHMNEGLDRLVAQSMEDAASGLWTLWAGDSDDCD